MLSRSDARSCERMRLTCQTGSDIDTLVVAPRHVKREQFFEHYPTVLRRMTPAGAVSSLTAVPDSFVPIIKLVLSGIDIDLIFVSLSLATIPLNLDLRDNKLLDSLDQASIKSITGPVGCRPHLSCIFTDSFPSVSPTRSLSLSPNRSLSERHFESSSFGHNDERYTRTSWDFPVVLPGPCWSPESVNSTHRQMVPRLSADFSGS